MNTPAHLIFGLAAFGQPERRAVTAAAFIGALIPDFSLYAMAGWHLKVLGAPAEVVFGQLYFSDEWQRVFRVDNSILLWGIALGMSIMARSQVAGALCGAALLHLGLDLLLHHDDGRAHSPLHSVQTVVRHQRLDDPPDQHQLGEALKRAKV